MTVAIWCILVALILPYVAFSFVKGVDPNQPRHGVGDLADSPVGRMAPTSTASRPFRGSPRR